MSSCTRMKKAGILFCVVFSLIPGLSRSQDAAGLIDSAAYYTFVHAVNLVDHHAYADAVAAFEALIDAHPNHPMGYFGVAATYQTIMRNYRVNVHEAEYDSVLNRSIEIGMRAVKTNRKDAPAWFYLGGAYGFRGLYKVRKRDWLGAFSDGLKGLRALERALDIDPTLYDAYYGLGLYHYWRSAKAKVLGIPVLFARDKERGIQEIWKAIRLGRYSEVSGKYALVATYYDNGEYEKAWDVNQELFERFPTDPSCLYMRSRLCAKLGRWEQTRDVVRRLLEHIRSTEYRSIGYEVECYFRMALSEYYLGLPDEAYDHLRTALELADRRDAAEEVEGPLEEFQEIVKQATALFREIEERMQNSDR